MSKLKLQTVRPVLEVEEAKAYYAELGLSVDYFSALWHTFNVGHIMSVDLPLPHQYLRAALFGYWMRWLQSTVHLGAFGSTTARK